jgi:hypothetical protein
VGGWGSREELDGGKEMEKERREGVRRKPGKEHSRCRDILEEV